MEKIAERTTTQTAKCVVLAFHRRDVVNLLLAGRKMVVPGER